MKEEARCVLEERVAEMEAENHAAQTAMDRLVAVRVELRAEGKVLFQWRA